MPLRAVLIDLDETLYAPGAALIRAVDTRITAFIAIRTGLPWPRADELRRVLWREFGTTARGLNRLFDISERDLNRFAVDSVDPQPHLSPDPALRDHLARIPAPCHLFTNATRRYAERVLSVLGVSESVGLIFDIEFSLFNPKPAPIFYRRAVEALGVSSRDVALVDDNPRNLRPALEMGMACVYMGDGAPPAGALRARSFAEVPELLRTLT
ncbi:MAG: HAD-IA family hydrolase [Armatimonadetes bacterium]|nr:HAD-IA family hydrolase [Armatimonadota bacterium]